MDEPFLVESGWVKSIFIPHTGGESYRVLIYKDGTHRFEHRCKRADDDSVICAPSLRHHTIENEEPLTISPSILCSDCDTHGYIRQGRWVEA